MAGPGNTPKNALVDVQVRVLLDGLLLCEADIADLRRCEDGGRHVVMPWPGVGIVAKQMMHQGHALSSHMHMS